MTCHHHHLTPRLRNRVTVVKIRLRLQALKLELVRHEERHVEAVVVRVRRRRGGRGRVHVGDKLHPLLPRRQVRGDGERERGTGRHERYLRPLQLERVLGHAHLVRGGRVRGRGARVPVLIVHVSVHDPAVVSKAGQVLEHVPTVLALVDLVSPVRLDVGTQVVPSSVPTPAYVTGEGFFPRVDAHVATEVGGADELAAANVADEGSVRFRFRLLVL